MYIYICVCAPGTFLTFIPGGIIICVYRYSVIPYLGGLLGSVEGSTYIQATILEEKSLSDIYTRSCVCSRLRGWFE